MKLRLAALAAAAMVAALAGASSASSAAPPGPDAAKMTLQASDFPGAHASGQRLAGSGAIVGGFENVIRLDSPFGKSHYRVFDSISMVAADVQTGIAIYHQFGRQFSSKANRLQLIASLLSQAGVTADPRAISLLTPRALGVDDSSMEVGFVVKVGKQRLNVSITLVRLDRVIDADLAVGTGTSVALVDGQAVVHLAASHIAAGLVPVGLETPELTGAVAVGQVLTVSTGTWTGAATTFTYQWQRCNAAGASCVDVPGATGVTYRVTAADSHSTLRANVTAAGRFGHGSAPSRLSAVVP
jgi:hypothetical protein